ncbi:MAG: class I SAM-dependent methyltransferase [Planctomycetaceae bacterium]
MALKNWLKQWRPAGNAEAADAATKLADPSRWVSPFSTLREKWTEVPTSSTVRRKTGDLLKLSDQELVDVWKGCREDVTTGVQFAHRGWYHALYKDVTRGKRMLDVGSGFGVDTITFAMNGAEVTFMDLAESNLEVLKRLCNALGVKNVAFHYLENFDSFRKLQGKYDIIWAQGSLIHAPFTVAREECQELLKYLPIGGRWIELCYPEERWRRDGSPSFDSWASRTDGGAPWVEWYDVPKILKRMEPVDFEVVLAFNFHNDDFNWFDLLRVS